MKPACLYVAAQAVSSAESRSSINFDLDEAALVQIPWIRNWKRTFKVTLVRGEEKNVHSSSDFATLDHISMSINDEELPLRKFALCTGDPSNPVEKSAYFGSDNEVEECSNTDDEASGDDGDGENEYKDGEEDGEGDEIDDDEAQGDENADAPPGRMTLTLEIANEYGTDENVFHFSTDKILADLPLLTSLYLFPQCTETSLQGPSDLIGEWKFDFTSLARLRKFQIGFQARNDDPGRTAIAIKSGPGLTDLSILSVGGYGGFMLDTTGVPNLVSLEVSEFFWPLYWHSQHATLHTPTLESLKLYRCFLGNSSWTVKWPANLTHLHLDDPSVYPRRDQADFDERTASTILNLNTLPTGLRSLVIKTHLLEYSFRPGLALRWQDLDKEAEAEPEDEPFDEEVLQELVTENDLDELTFGVSVIFSPGLIADGGLPCKNLESLELNRCVKLASFDVLPRSLHTLTCSTGLAEMSDRAHSLAVAFPDIQFDSSSPFRNLRRVHMGKAWWDHLAPLKQACGFLAGSAIAQGAAHGQEKSINLIDWSLYSMMDSLGANITSATWNSLDLHEKAAVVEKAWVSANKNVLSTVDVWTLAPSFPAEVSGFVMHPNLDSDYGLRLCSNAVTSMDTDGTNPLPAVVLFTPIGDLKPLIEQPEKDQANDELPKSKSFSSAPSVLHLFQFDSFDWECLNKSITRLEVRGITSHTIASMSNLRLPNLQYLFVSEQESLNPLAVKELRLDNWVSPLKELAVLSYADRIRWPTRFAFPHLERVVTTNALSDLGVSDFLDGAPLLRVLVSLNLGGAPVPPSGSPLAQWLTNDAEMAQNIPEQVATLVLNGTTVKQTLVSFRKVRNRTRPRPF